MVHLWLIVEEKPVYSSDFAQIQTNSRAVQISCLTTAFMVLYLLQRGRVKLQREDFVRQRDLLLGGFLLKWNETSILSDGVKSEPRDRKMWKRLCNAKCIGFMHMPTSSSRAVNYHTEAHSRTHELETLERWAQTPKTDSVSSQLASVTDSEPLRQLASPERSYG